MADLYSLFSQKPGILNIEALEDTETILLSKANRKTLPKSQIRAFFPHPAEKSLVASQQRWLYLWGWQPRNGTTCFFTATQHYRPSAAKTNSHTLGYTGVFSRMRQDGAEKFIDHSSWFIAKPLSHEL